MKGYKVTDSPRTKICGIAASSLKELKSKACTKFQITDESKYYFVLLDGTIVDNEPYFKTIPPQTLFILAKEGEDLCTGAEIIYNALKAVNIEYLRAGDQIKQFFEENVKEKIKVLSDELARIEESKDKTSYSSRKDHPEWFEGLETACSTKEEFLRRRCKDRISGYFYKACIDLRKSCITVPEKKLIEDIISKLKQMLNLHGYNAAYFDRNDKRGICDQDGCFVCAGLWNKNRCLYVGKNAHKINPYRSKEDRIVFSTWNLDHRIEKSRTIIPCILTALKKRICYMNRFDFNYDLIFSLLFTSANLRLVHIVCHDKGSHATASLQPEDLIVDHSNNHKKEVISRDLKDSE